MTTTQNPTAQKVVATMLCRAQGVRVQIEGEIHGVSLRKKTCSLQAGCPRHKLPADGQFGPCAIA
jgi:ribosomal protein S3